jgi:uncharacterized membrane protein YgcG
MKRLAVTLAGLVVLAIAVLWPALRYDSGGPGATDTTTISRYLADFTVADNGDLTATETLTVTFPDSGKHGIFRFFDRSDPSAPHARRDPHDISVSMDGAPVPVDLSTQASGRYVVARIGDPDVTVAPGDHTYVIRYRIDGVLEPGTDGAPTQFYWNLIPGGWAQEIDQAHLTVHLPAPFNTPPPVQCAVGVGATTGCTRVVSQGRQTLGITTVHLPPRTPVTLKVGLPIPTPPAGTTVPWSARWDPVLGESVVPLVVVLLLAAASGVAGAVLAHGAHERTPPYPLQYAPPDGIGPAEGTYVVTERIDDKAFVASLLWAAQQGAIDLTRDGDTWTITDKGGEAGWTKVDPVTASVAPLLGGPGGTFRASRGDVTSGQVLQSRIAAFEAETREWGKQNGYLASAGLGAAGTLLTIGAIVGVVALGVFNWLGMSITALIPGAFALAALPLLLPTSRTKRTAAGRDLWSRLGGFRRVLSTPSSKERFDFSGRQELYTAYIPWAVAFGCADEWADKYRTEVGTDPPVPAYFAGYYAGALTGSSVNQMVGDFSSTVASSISAYQATQSHSSGGGGGFSGGGGGGGGGGGSW